MNEDLMKGTSPGARAIMSDSGWSTASVFQDYLDYHFLKYVRTGPDDKQPILLILDGHTTHTSRSMIDWVFSKNVHIFVLPAHFSLHTSPLSSAIITVSALRT